MLTIVDRVFVKFGRLFPNVDNLIIFHMLILKIENQIGNSKTGLIFQSYYEMSRAQRVF